MPPKREGEITVLLQKEGVGALALIQGGLITLPVYGIFVETPTIMDRIRVFDLHLRVEAERCYLDMVAGTKWWDLVDKDYSNE